MKTEFFNMERFGLLLKRQYILNFKSWMIALVSVAGFIIFISFLNLISTQNDSWITIFNSLGVVVFFITGMVFASLSFSEMGTYSKSLQYITLPASRFEKFFSAWLSTSIFYFIVSTLTLVISSAFIGMLSALIFKGDFLVFNPFTAKYAEVLLAYMIGHSAFFLGAVWFRKGAFFKTLLTMFVINIITNTWLAVWTMIIINPFRLIAESKSMYVPNISFCGIESLFQYIIIGFFITLSVIFLITAWIRFKEREV